MPLLLLSPETSCPGCIRRVAHYGPLAIRYTVSDEDSDDYDILGYSFNGHVCVGEDEILEALMKAFGITVREIIENAPKTTEA